MEHIRIITYALAMLCILTITVIVILGQYNYNHHDKHLPATPFVILVIIFGIELAVLSSLMQL